MADLTVAEVSDLDGFTVKGVPFKGILFPPFDVSVIANLESVKLRDDDTILCSYPKSGTHWLWEICRLLVAGKLEQDDTVKNVTMIEQMPEEKLECLPSPRILNTHVQFRYLPAEVVKKKIKIILIHRNPKDVAVSSFYDIKRRDFYDGKFETYVQAMFAGKFFYGSWFDYVTSWEDVKKSHPELPFLSLLYEDLKEDPVRETKKMMKFLGLERSEEFVQQVCDQCGFESMKKLKATSHVGSSFFRKGQVGDWKNMFTVSLNDWLDQEYKEQMADYPVRMRFTLD